MHFLSLASGPTTFLLGLSLKSKFRFFDAKKVTCPYAVRFVLLYFFSPFLFLMLLRFAVSDWPSTGLSFSSKIPEKTSSRRAILVWCKEFSEQFRAYFRHHWKDLFPPAESEYRWCQFSSKTMTSEVQQRSMLVTTGYSGHRRQQQKTATLTKTLFYKFR